MGRRLMAFGGSEKVGAAFMGNIMFFSLGSLFGFSMNRPGLLFAFVITLVTTQVAFAQVEKRGSKRGPAPSGWRQADWETKKKVLLEHYKPTDAELALIDAALPETATVKPRKQRRILSFYKCDFPHDSIATGIAAFEKLGAATGAFSIESTDDPAVFNKDNLSKYDAVMLNNAVGFDTFLNDDQRAAFLDFVQKGGGIIGIHGATSACEQWPEGAEVTGGVFQCHPWTARGTWAAKVESPEHELNSAWKNQSTWFRDELYIYRGGSFARERSRVLLSMDMTKTRNLVGKGMDMKTQKFADPKGDFPIAWIHRHGGGRVFCSNLGHNNFTYWNPVVLQHYLDGIQYALGDLTADETPSAKIDPAKLVRAKAKRIVFLAGRPSHASGQHEFNAGCKLLAKRLNEQTDLPIQADVISGWPEDDSVLDGAAAIVIYCDSDSVQREHYLRMMELAKSGVGLLFMHYGVHPKKIKSGQDYYMPTVGGFMETGFSVNPHWVADLEAASDHPIGRGYEKPAQVYDELYYSLRFDEKAIPLVTAVPKADKLVPINLWNDNGPAGFGKKQTLLWGFTRPDGSRGGGFTGGHYHRNWVDDGYRTVVLNSIVWVAGLDVPEGGVQSSKVSEEEINSNLDKKSKMGKISLPLKPAIEYYHEMKEKRKKKAG